MPPEHLIQRYRHWYAQLLRLYSKPYRERFSEGMVQTFSDLLRERAKQEKGLFGYVFWVFLETSVGIIRDNLTQIVMQNKNIIRILVGTGLILLLPFLAMQFTNEVDWDLADFVVAGILLSGTGVMFELATRKAGQIAHRIGAGIAVMAALFLIWINLAVGIIGTEDNPANLLYVGVLAVGLIGAIFARFRPSGMARVLFATALAHVLVAVIALVAGLGPTLPLDGIFIALWVGSALLFRRASVTADPTRP